MKGKAEKERRTEELVIIVFCDTVSSYKLHTAVEVGARPGQYHRDILLKSSDTILASEWETYRFLCCTSDSSIENQHKVITDKP